MPSMDAANAPIVTGKNPVIPQNCEFMAFSTHKHNKSAFFMPKAATYCRASMCHIFNATIDN